MMRALTIGLLCLLAVACGPGTKGAADKESVPGDTLTHHSQLLTIVDAGDYRVADIRNPWDTTQVLQRLVLYSRGTDLGDDVPDGVRIEVPLRRSAVFSSVHAGAIAELGHIDAVTAVADAQYFKIPAIVEGLASGAVTDVGGSVSPSMERLLMSSPDAILVSPYDDGGNQELMDSKMAPVVLCADWMEPTPLGRAEWLLLLGELYGDPQLAKKILDKVVADYTATAAAAADGAHPVVLTETVNSGVWYVPGGQSYMARLIADAGGRYPWADDGNAGSLPLSLEEVYDRAGAADVWLVKSYGTDLSLNALAVAEPRYKNFAAYAAGNVWGSDTKACALYEEFPFHPERLLREYYLIFNPDAKGEMRYFKRLK